MIVVSDASPLIAFAALGEIRLLDLLYREVLVPERVYAEATARHRPGAEAVRSAAFLRVVQVENTALAESLAAEVDAGEAEAIALAIQTNADALMIDERKARQVARRLGLPLTGVLGTLVLAKQRGLIADIAPVLDRMEKIVRFRVSARLRAATLRAAGEVP